MHGIALLLRCSALRGKRKWMIFATSLMIRVWKTVSDPRLWLASLALAASVTSAAADLKFEVSGVPEPLLSNVIAHVSAFSIERQSEVSDGNYDDILANSIAKARSALRPYGYYHPDISGRVVRNGRRGSAIRLDIKPGPPMLIDQVRVELVGEGAQQSVLQTWRSSWPLGKGKILDQTLWQERKQFALVSAERIGYLDAQFTEHRIELDLDANRANLLLTLDTGKRFVFGDVHLGEHMLKPGILEYIPRFQSGDPYSAFLLEKFRVDLWKTGYFTSIAVEEVRNSNVEPPVVDLNVVFETTTRNTYQGSLGLGSDTGARVQTQWTRQPMSSNGDSLDVGFGWQETDDEYSARGAYRLPRRDRARQFWTGDLVLRHEGIDLDVKRSVDDEFIRIATGTTDERHLRVGHLKVRNFKVGAQQAFETFFVQGLSASDELRPLESVPELLTFVDNPEAERLLKGTDKTLSIGFDYDRVAVSGRGWDVTGHRERAWIFTSNEAFGSDRDFTQVYVSTRRSFIKGERWKFILRAELGYTDARVDEYSIKIDDVSLPLPLSVTNLPNFYRFNAGGSRSVRGYGFEELSNNQIGSNNISTASAEVEVKIFEKWSAAAFVDIGNAFNDWSDPQLKKGVGFGIRWYSIAGPIRIDIARALDLVDKPWRLHFTIGTPLL